jgi:small-conductance mechanosensitive channel
MITLGAMLLSWGLVSAARAADFPAASSEYEQLALEQVETAPVVVDGIELFRVRGVSAFPADKRADLIAERIVALARDPAFNPDALRVDPRPEVVAVVGGTQLIMGIYRSDGDIEGLDQNALASAVVIRVREAIEAWRADRNLERLQRNGLIALGATLAMLLGMWLVTRIYRWLRGLNEARVRQHIRDVSIGGFRVVRAQQIAGLVTAVLVLLWMLFLLGSLYVYLSSVLVLFPWTRGLATGLIDLVMNPLRIIGLGLLGAVPNLVFLVVIVVITRYLLKLIRLYFRGIEDGTVVLREFDPDWALPTYRLVRLLLVAFMVIIAYPYIPGSGSEAFKGISIFIGVVFSLGSSSVIGNMIAGYTMTYRRVFKIGDVVKINDNFGTVEQIRMLVTYLRSPKNEMIAIPNSEILNGEVVNYSILAKKDGLILHTTVGIGYETPWRQVEAMLHEAAARTPGILKNPAPFVLQRSLGDFCVVYELNVYTDESHGQMQRYTDLHRNILDVFNEYGVQIMTPAYEGDPEQPKVVPKDQWFLAPAHPREPASGP